MPRSTVSIPAPQVPVSMYIIGARNRCNPSGTVTERIFTKKDDQTLAKVTARYFPGATIIAQKGLWFDPIARALVEEESRSVIVAHDNEEDHTAWRNQVVSNLQQLQILRVAYGAGVFYNTSPSAFPPNQNLDSATHRANKAAKARRARARKAAGQSG